MMKNGCSFVLLPAEGRGAIHTTSADNSSAVCRCFYVPVFVTVWVLSAILRGLLSQLLPFQRRPQPDRQAKVKVPQHRPPLRSGKLTAEKKSPQKRCRVRSTKTAERFRELAVIRFNRVCACCGMLHNAYSDLCGTENGCASRLWFLGTNIPALLRYIDAFYSLTIT